MEITSQINRQMADFKFLKPYPKYGIKKDTIVRCSWLNFKDGTGGQIWSELMNPQFHKSFKDVGELADLLLIQNKEGEFEPLN